MAAWSAERASPNDTAELPRLNHGNTTCIISPKPPASSPNRSPSVSSTSRRTGAESLPRNPMPSNAP
ncbi:MAG: hypothetical protein WAT13_19235 [Candidatus Microthrix parvicella]